MTSTPKPSRPGAYSMVNPKGGALAQEKKVPSEVEGSTPFVTSQRERIANIFPNPAVTPPIPAPINYCPSPTVVPLPAANTASYDPTISGVPIIPPPKIGSPLLTTPGSTDNVTVVSDDLTREAVTGNDALKERFTHAELETYRLKILSETRVQDEFRIFSDYLQAKAYLTNPPGALKRLTDKAARSAYNEAVSYTNMYEQNAEAYKKTFLSAVALTEALDRGFPELDSKETRVRINVLQKLRYAIQFRSQVAVQQKLLADNPWLTPDSPFPEQADIHAQAAWVKEKTEAIYGLHNARKSFSDIFAKKSAEAGTLYAEIHGLGAARRAFGNRFIGPFEMGLLLKNGDDFKLPRNFPSDEEIERGAKLGANLVYHPGPEAHWVMSMPRQLDATSQKDVVEQAKAVRDFMTQHQFLTMNDAEKCSDEILERIKNVMRVRPQEGMAQLRELPVASGFHTFHEINHLLKLTLSNGYFYVTETGHILLKGAEDKKNVTIMQGHSHGYNCESLLEESRPLKDYLRRDRPYDPNLQAITDPLPHDGRSVGVIDLKPPLLDYASGWEKDGWPVVVRPVLGRWY